MHNEARYEHPISVKPYWVYDFDEDEDDEESGKILRMIARSKRHRGYRSYLVPYLSEFDCRIY